MVWCIHTKFLLFSSKHLRGRQLSKKATNPHLIGNYCLTVNVKKRKWQISDFKGSENYFYTHYEIMRVIMLQSRKANKHKYLHTFNLNVWVLPKETLDLTSTHYRKSGNFGLLPFSFTHTMNIGITNANVWNGDMWCQEVKTDWWGALGAVFSVEERSFCWCGLWSFQLPKIYSIHHKKMREHQN